MNDKKQGILVIKGDLAKKLLALNFKIIDLMPKRELDGSFDYTRSVFIFKNEDGLLEAIDRLK
jgi:hypothetical protein